MLGRDRPEVSFVSSFCHSASPSAPVACLPLRSTIIIGKNRELGRIHRRADFIFESMPRFQVPPPLRGFRGSEVSEVIWTLKLLGTVTELRISLKKVSYGTLTLRGQSSAPLWS